MPLSFLCLAAVAIDGDTLRCANIVQARGLVRLARIDAPELPRHCQRGRACAPGDPFASRTHLARLVRAPVRCTQVSALPWADRFVPFDRYGRVVARCSAGGRDLGDAQLAGGFAIRWPHE